MLVYIRENAQIIAEYTDGSLTKKYIYGPGIDNPVAMINVNGQTETWYYYYADALGSIRLITDESGNVVEGYTYDVYGKPYVMTSGGYDNNWMSADPGATFSVHAVSGHAQSAIGNPYMFTARRWHSVTGLYYYRFRDYAPDLGRFLQPDPAGYIDTMNLYAYCANNPINWIDPWGLDTEKPWWEKPIIMISVDYTTHDEASSRNKMRGQVGNVTSLVVGVCVASKFGLTAGTAAGYITSVLITEFSFQDMKGQIIVTRTTFILDNSFDFGYRREVEVTIYREEDLTKEQIEYWKSQEGVKVTMPWEIDETEDICDEK